MILPIPARFRSLPPVLQNAVARQRVGPGLRVLLSASRIQERFSNLSALAEDVQGVFFLRKKPLGGFGSGVEQLENR
jgi:hypothetical protein